MSRTKQAAADTATATLVEIRTPPKIPLQSLEDVRREAARVYREARAGKIETADASRLSFMLQTIGKLIEQATIERRIERLENPTKRLTQANDIDDAKEIRGQEPA